MSEIVKEKEICSNKKITVIDNKNIYFEAKMKGYTEIKSWIMSMGNEVKVIEPRKLRKDIINEINDLKIIYEK